MPDNNITSGFDTQYMKIDRLESVLISLEQALAPVLGPESGTIPGPRENQDRNSSPLLDTINEHNYKLSVLISIADDIRERLTLLPDPELAANDQPSLAQ